MLTNIYTILWRHTNMFIIIIIIIIIIIHWCELYQ